MLRLLSLRMIRTCPDRFDSEVACAHQWVWLGLSISLAVVIRSIFTTHVSALSEATSHERTSREARRATKLATFLKYC